jgi:hypothetical protein
MFVGFDEEQSLKRNVDRRDEMLSRILDYAARIMMCRSTEIKNTRSSQTSLKAL